MGRPSQGRKSSGCCPTVSVVVFVSLALVGLWMLMSSSAEAYDSSESLSLTNSHGKRTVSGRFPKFYEDTQTDLPDDAVSGNDKSEESSDESEVKEELQGNEEEKKEEDERVSEDSSEIKQETEEDEKSSGEGKSETEDEEKTSGETEEETPEKPVIPAGGESELGKEETDQTGTSWSTQAVESENEIESQKGGISTSSTHSWKLCNVTAGQDYIPCLDNWQAIKKLHGRSHYEHRERHCPETPPSCLVPLPKGYRRSIEWPKSREKVWFRNVPNKKLAVVKGHQNWVKVTGDYLTFPGGGTQFIHGALHYIDFIQTTLKDVAWGKRTRVILDVGCGVASFGGFLFDRNVLAMSLAPKDEHEAQVQFALERGIPAILAVMGTRRLPFPGAVFDVVHCARCRVPWHVEGGKLLLELNRLLRPGGYFIWSATPIYQTLPEDVEIWKAMKKLMKSMCWRTMAIQKDALNAVAVAIFQKPVTNECYEERAANEPPMCDESDNPNAAWNVKLEACMHPVTTNASQRGARWPELWPKRLVTAPYWLKSETGVYGRKATADFVADYKHWKNVVENSYMSGLGFNLSAVRNVMDMRAVYGGFAAALKDLPLWVMNVVPIDSPDTLPVIFERGLFGMYHDWCESFNSYPRTYDLLHADRLFSSVKQRCELVPVMAEVDRLLRPEGKLIVRDDVEVISEVESIAKSMHWEIRLIYTKDEEGLLCVRKTKWRPKEVETVWSAIM